MDSIHTQPIAIIGLSAALPECGDDLEKLSELLHAGADLIAPVPSARMRDGGYAPDTALSECALLDRIDTFDHRFFGMSMREAKQMDPQQRLLLQLSCKAIWDAGYPLKALRGSRTAVIFGAASEDYSTLMSAEEAPLMTGLLLAAQAGRVAYELDLRGPAQTINTACSSSLSAVLEAVRKLNRGEVDCVLAGGVRLFSRPPLAIVPGNEGILSPKGRARSFDAAADGTGLGEGGAVFMLKTLARAQADGDCVHAAILGGASNQDGGSSNGFAAPSTAAQSDLLLEAWRDAGINPATLGMIEAHGTGTRLGDPIEFQALNEAFGRETDRTGFCVLSSMKSNIGHLDSAAGAAGLLKAVVALKRGKRYASAHFSTPNPLLECENSALRLSSETEPWPSVGPRRAGVSSFGITGTNVHVLLEEAAIEDSPDGTPVTDGASPSLLIPLSARSEAALCRHAARLADHLEAGHTHLADLAFVQATCRDHENWRAAFHASTMAEAISSLRRIAEKQGVVCASSEAAVTILLPHEGALPSDFMRAWRETFPTPAETARPAEASEHPLSMKLALLRGLLAAGLSDRNLIGHGSGNLVVDALRTQSDLSPETVSAKPTTVAPLDPARLRGAFKSLSIQGPLALVAPWQGSLADITAKTLTHDIGQLIQMDFAVHPRQALMKLIAELYVQGVEIDWVKFTRYAGGYGRRVWLPTDLFEPVRCWVDPVAPTAVAGTPSDRNAASSDEANGPGVEAELAAIWRRLLDAGDLKSEDDFFDLGGDSLMQVQLENAVRERLNYELSFDDVFDHPTLGGLAAFIAEKRGVGSKQAATFLKDADGTETERGLAAIWCRLLDAQAVGRHEDFFDLGGDSLMHVQLENAVRESFGVDLGIDDVYDHPTLAELAAFIAEREDGDRGGGKGPIALPGRDHAPVTHSQKRMWLLQQMAPESGAYNVCATFRLDGTVDESRLRAALDRLVRRHGILRTRFVFENGRLAQQIAETTAFDLETQTLSHGEQAAEAMLAAHAARPFDLSEVGALRALLLKPETGPETGWFQLVLHHAICDEWSLDLLLRELADEYEGNAIPAPALQFVDWAVWEADVAETETFRRGRTYWRKTLEGVPVNLPLPTDHARNTQENHDGAWLKLELAPDRVDRMKTAARRAGGTLFTWLLTGYAAWISRVSQSTDFIVGVPIAGRNHAAAENIPGCFINTLPIRVDTGGGAGFDTLFGRIRKSLSGALDHQLYPFDRMVDDLGVSGDAAQPPLVQTLLSLQGGNPAASDAFRLGKARARPVQLQGAVSWLDLSAVLWEARHGGLEGIFAYRTALFEEATIRSFWREWSDLLEMGLTIR
ncbi:MAG: condensation domain-containing protein, partial [Pseudomonadota bacterium]